MGKKPRIDCQVQSYESNENIIISQIIKGQVTRRLLCNAIQCCLSVIWWLKQFLNATNSIQHAFSSMPPHMAIALKISRVKTFGIHLMVRFSRSPSCFSNCPLKCSYFNAPRFSMSASSKSADVSSATTSKNITRSFRSVPNHKNRTQLNPYIIPGH